jgi:hypothetical protein
MDYGKDLLSFLEEVGNADVDQIKTDFMEVVSEKGQEQEGCLVIDITNLAKVAANRIGELEHDLAQVATLAERATTFGGKRSDIAARARENLRF